MWVTVAPLQQHEHKQEVKAATAVSTQARCDWSERHVFVLLRPPHGQLRLRVCGGAVIG